MSILVNKLNQSTDWDVIQKCFLVFSFLPYLGGILVDSSTCLVMSLIISTLAIVASIYCWRHNQEIRYLIMAFLVSAFPACIFLLFYTLIFFFGQGL